VYKPSSLIAVRATARALAPYTRLLPMDVVDHMRMEMRMVLTAHCVGMALVHRVAAGLGAGEARRDEPMEGRPDAAGAIRAATGERGRDVPQAAFVILHRLHKPLSVMHTLLEHLATDEQISMPADDMVLPQLNRLCDSMAAAMLMGLVVEYPRVRSRAERDEIDEALFEALVRATAVLNRATARLAYREKDLLATLRSYRWNARRAARALVMRERAVSKLCSTTLQNLGAALREELGAPP
jgi:hypothetical protein